MSDPPGAGVTGGCEPPGVRVGNQMLVLWKNTKLLITRHIGR